MKFQLGSFLQVDTNDKYHPVVLSDALVDIFYGLTAVLHGWQAYRYRNNPLWIALHGVSAAFSAYWPYMIHMGYTHKGLGHSSYGLASLVPHITSVQVFGGLMILDKLINLNDLVWPTGQHVFSRTKPLNSYGTDNLFLDNMIVPKTPAGLAVNIPFMAVTGVAQLALENGPKFGLAIANASQYLNYVNAANLAAGAITAIEDWILGYDPRKNK